MKRYRCHIFAKMIGVHPNTLRNWDKDGTLKALRSSKNHRYYTDEHLGLFKHMLISKTTKSRVNIVYCRVSSKSQKKDLQSQLEAMQMFTLAKGWEIDEYVREIGGGLNLKRPELLRVLDMIDGGQVERLIVAHKDRLARFGVEFIEHICKKNNTELIIVNQERLSPQAELVEDMLTIVHSFSSRLYGLRKYNKKIRDIVAIEDNS